MREEGLWDHSSGQGSQSLIISPETTVREQCLRKAMEAEARM